MIRIITQFEILPTELIYRTFEYLDDCDIHLAFSNLNQRFYNLVLNYRNGFSLNLISCTKSKFDHICHELISNIKHARILSLSISNCHRSFGCKNYPHVTNQISLFFTQFKLDQFVNLRILKVFDVQNINFLTEIASLVKSLHQLYQLHITSKWITYDIVRLIFLSSSLKHLTLKGYNGYLGNGRIQLPTANIERLILKISIGSYDLVYISQYLPRLRYLNVTSSGGWSEAIDPKDLKLFELEELKLELVSYLAPICDEVQLFLNHIPKLRRLKLHIQTNDYGFLYPNDWIKFATSLEKFSFIFIIRMHSDTIDYIKQIASRFHVLIGPVEFLYSPNLCTVYTPPFTDDEWFGMQKMIALSTENNNLPSMKSFRTVQKLYVSGLPADCQYYSNIKSLTLNDTVTSEEISSLSKNIDLTKIEHLYFINQNWSTDLFELTKNLTSLETNNEYLIPLVSNNEVCQLLKRKIKRLCISPAFQFPQENLQWLYQTFSNIEELTIGLKDNDNVIELINNLKHLSYLTIQLDYKTFTEEELADRKLLKFNTLKRLKEKTWLNNFCLSLYDDICSSGMTLWIDI